MGLIMRELGLRRGKIGGGELCLERLENAFLNNPYLNCILKNTCRQVGRHAEL